MTPQERPVRPQRIIAHEHCSIAREDGEFAIGILLNLSERGFSVESRRALDVGEHVEIRVAGMGFYAGIIRWADGNRAGGVLKPYANGAFD